MNEGEAVSIDRSIDPQIIFNTNFVQLESQMLPAKFQDHRTYQPKRVKSLNSGQNLSHIFFCLDFHVLLFFQLSGTCLINCHV